jgi:hypothetical protein
MIDLVKTNDLDFQGSQDTSRLATDRTKDIDCSKPLYLPIQTLEDLDRVLTNVKIELGRLVAKNLISYSNSHIVYRIRGIHSSNIFLVADLASSEKIRKSIYLGEKLQETVEKSTSLVAFSKAINYLLEDKRESINFGECRLLDLLKDSLGGNCRTCYVISISLKDEDKDPTLNSLIFAQKINSIENVVQVANPSVKRADLKSSYNSNYQSLKTQDIQHSRQKSVNASWIEKCNSFMVDNGSEVKKLRERNTVLENQIIEIEKLAHFKNLDHSRVSHNSVNKNLSFLSENDESMNYILEEDARKEKAPEMLQQGDMFRKRKKTSDEDVRSVL